MNPEIRKYVSRYVVPFYYDNDRFECLCEYFRSNSTNNMAGLPKDGEWISAGFWENYKSNKDIRSEMDLYSYLPLMFIEKNKDDISNLGSSFVYKTNGKLFELVFDNNGTAFECRDTGILIFRNGIGFIWYEIEFKKGVCIDEYVEFQSKFKELSRTHEKRFQKKVGYDKEKKEAVLEDFCLGIWLSKFFSADTLGIRFWAERETESDSVRILIPDKALLFQYILVDPISKQEQTDLLFHIANGYNKKYSAPDDVEDKIFSPFGNTYFYISKAGMACVANNANTNSESSISVIIFLFICCYHTNLTLALIIQDCLPDFRQMKKC